MKDHELLDLLSSLASSLDRLSTQTSNFEASAELYSMSNNISQYVNKAKEKKHNDFWH